LLFLLFPLPVFLAALRLHTNQAHLILLSELHFYCLKMILASLLTYQIQIYNSCNFALVELISLAFLLLTLN
jgi:hypothetical protein